MAKTKRAPVTSGGGENYGDGTASTTIAEIEAYERQYQKWENRGNAILRRYRDERSDAANARIVARKFNILWSNVETLKPTLYARLPRVQVERRFKDADPVGRVACEIAERLGNYTVQTTGLDGVLRSCVHDRLLPGRAIAWVNYHADLAEVEETFDQDELEKPVAKGAEDGGDYEGPEEAEPELEKIRETIEPIYVAWEDFGHQPKRTWQEVNKAWRRVYLTRSECKSRFGDDIGAKLPLDRKHNDDAGKTDLIFDTATIYEVWDKKRSKVCWVAKSEKDYLDEIDPPVELEGFWPFPKPLWATMTNETLVPIPDYTLYQDQAMELDKITNRIGRLTDALKIAGVYDGSVPELARLLAPNGTPDNMLIAVANWGGLSEKGGLKAGIQLVPLADIVATVVQLYTARDQVLNVIYQVTGISDIIRGSSNPNETATAQGIKGQFASLRIKDIQAEVARFSRDIARIMVEIGVEMFEPETIYDMVQADSFTQMTPQEQQRAAMMAQFAQMTGQHFPPPKPREQFAQALQMLRSDKMRSFHIDIETDSTIALDDQVDKAQVTEFLTALGGFMQTFGPMMQQMPALAPVAGEALLFAARRYKAGRPLEASIEKAMGQIEQQVQAPKPPDPKTQLVQAQVEATKTRAQIEAAKGQAEVQQSGQEHQQNLQFKQIAHQQDLQANAQQHQQDLQHSAMEMRMKQQQVAKPPVIALVR